MVRESEAGERRGGRDRADAKESAEDSSLNEAELLTSDRRSKKKAYDVGLST